MKKQRIIVPKSILTNDEMEMVASKLFKCGYAVQKGTYTTGEFKGTKYIEFWTGDATNE